MGVLGARARGELSSRGLIGSGTRGPPLFMIPNFVTGYRNPPCFLVPNFAPRSPGYLSVPYTQILEGGTHTIQQG